MKNGLYNQRKGSETMIDINIAADGTITLYECDPAKNTACKHEMVRRQPPGMNRICNATAPRTPILH